MISAINMTALEQDIAEYSQDKASKEFKGKWTAHHKDAEEWTLTSGSRTLKLTTPDDKQPTVLNSYLEEIDG